MGEPVGVDAWVDQDESSGKKRKMYRIHNRDSPQPVDDVDLTISQKPTANNLCQGDTSSTDDIYITEYLSGGRYGSVYQAKHYTAGGDSENSICVKFMKIRPTNDPGDREKAVARAMRNEMVMYEAMKDLPSGTPICRALFLAMRANDDKLEELGIGLEYISHLNLHDGIDDGIVNKLHLYDILVQLSEANKYLKKKSIHHLDIKPKNIMYKPKQGSKSGQLKLIDFGSAKEVSKHNLSHGSYLKLETKPWGLTMHYAAPEVLLSERELSGSSEPGNMYSLHETTDLYSIGATAYHVVGRQIPWTSFEGDSSYVAGKSLKNVWQNITKSSKLQDLVEADWDHPLKRTIQSLLEVKYTERMNQETLSGELNDQYMKSSIREYEEYMERDHGEESAERLSLSSKTLEVSTASKGVMPAEPTDDALDDTSEIMYSPTEIEFPNNPGNCNLPDTELSPLSEPSHEPRVALSLNIDDDDLYTSPASATQTLHLDSLDEYASYKLNSPEELPSAGNPPGVGKN